jgi:hypothetical protein
MRGMEIGVAYATGLCFDQNLACPGRRDVPLFKYQRLTELLHNCGIHLAGHG